MNNLARFCRTTYVMVNLKHYLKSILITPEAHIYLYIISESQYQTNIKILYTFLITINKYLFSLDNIWRYLMSSKWKNIRIKQSIS